MGWTGFSPHLSFFCWWWGFGFLLIYFRLYWNRHCIYACAQFDKFKLNWIELKDKTWILHNMMMKFEIGNMITHRISKHTGNVYLPVTQFYWETLTFILRVNQSIIYVCHLVRGLFLYNMVSFWLRTKQATCQYLNDGLAYWQIYASRSLDKLTHFPLVYAHECQWNGSALVQIMACHLFSTKPLSKPILDYCQLDPGTNISEILIKIQNFSFT